MVTTPVTLPPAGSGWPPGQEDIHQKSGVIRASVLKLWMAMEQILDKESATA
jgi:hypothetical protein